MFTLPWHQGAHWANFGINCSEHPSLNFGDLTSAFVDALRLCKPQTVSFLNLPAEIRNHIYYLSIPDTEGYYTELRDLNLSQDPTLPPVALAFTCRTIQREILPMYLRTVNLRLSYDERRYLKACGGLIDSHTLEIMRTYAELDPSTADHLHDLRLEMSVNTCSIHVTDSKIVHVELIACGTWITSNALTFVSTLIRNKIADSLVDSPTGLLGLRHLLIAFAAVIQIRGWWQWMKQKEDWAYKKAKEVPWYRGACYLGCCKHYWDYLIEQAEEEGMPRLILATTSLQDTAEMYD